METMGLAIETQGLTRRFGSLVAVNGLNLGVPRGLIYGFLGPNGAGKSTTINMLVGLLPASAGEAQVAGYSVCSAPLEVKRRIGVVPEGLSLYERLTAAEQVELAGRLHGLGRQDLRERIPSLLESLDLGDARGKMILDFSAGMRKKTSLAAALVHAPDVLFLDEPFESVDPVSTRAIKNILRDMAEQRGTTVFFSTHVMELAERFCDRVAIVNHGQLVAEGSIPELRARVGLGEDAALEDVFLRAVHADVPEDEAKLNWLTGNGHGTEAPLARQEQSDSAAVKGR
jgi:ABC-2 type transport system ATP-binding protein